MDPASCRVIYIDDRFTAEKWLSRDTVLSPAANSRTNQASFLDPAELPLDLLANVKAILAVFNQVFVCNSGRSFSSKLADIQEAVMVDCTPILAIFDVDSNTTHDRLFQLGGQKSRSLSPHATSSPAAAPRQLTFSSEADESYGLQLLSRITSDLQVDEGIKLVIPVALVRVKRKSSNATPITSARNSYSGKDTSMLSVFDDKPSPIDPKMMLQCLDAGALDVVPSPLNNEKIMGLTVHAYRIYKTAKKDQTAFLASASKFIGAAGRRKQSWVGVEEEKPYAYLREAMVKKLLKGICEPETIIEDYQHRDLLVEESRKRDIIEEIGKWSFCAHDFSEDELVYAGYYILAHALQMPELEKWRMDQDEILRFMQASRVAYNSFVLYHNFRHAIDVLQSLFYFLVQIGAIPPYPNGSTPPPFSQDKSPAAQLLRPFEALTLLISAIGHDVGHPGVNNMFLIKLNAPLAQLYNDQSVLEAFHCAAYSQILRRHWPSVFAEKPLRKLLISSILATDMGVHPEYMQQLGSLQEKIHGSRSTDGWAPKEVDACRVLTCGLLIKCADISNVSRPWMVAERWTHLLQQEFASQGEMENQVGIETTLFGGPPELGNVLKLANGQIGFMGIFAHPLFANVTDVIPAMGFAAAEIIKNKSVWITKIEREKRRQQLISEGSFNDGAVSPRSQSPAPRRLENLQAANPIATGYFPASLRRHTSNPASPIQQTGRDYHDSSIINVSRGSTTGDTSKDRSEAPPWKSSFGENGSATPPNGTAPRQEAPSILSGIFPSAKHQIEARRPEAQSRKSSHALPRNLQLDEVAESHDESTTTTTTTASSEHGGYEEKNMGELPKSNFTTTSVPLIFDDVVPDLPKQQMLPEEQSTNLERSPNRDHIAAFSRYCPPPSRPFSQTHSQTRNSGRSSVPSTTGRNSMATSGSQTQSTSYSTILSPSTEATSFLNIESSDEQVQGRANDSWQKRGSSYGRVLNNPSLLPEVVPAHMMIRGQRGGGRTNSPIMKSTSMVKNPGQETTTSWEDGDGEKSIRKRISRLRFWRKRSDEEVR